MPEMRLVKLKDAPVKVEGKAGSVVIQETADRLAVVCAPDTGYIAAFTGFRSDGAYIVTMAKK